MAQGTVDQGTAQPAKQERCFAALLLTTLRTHPGIKAARFDPDSHDLTLSYDPREISGKRIESLAQRLSGELVETWEHCDRRRQGATCLGCSTLAQEIAGGEFSWQAEKVGLERPGVHGELHEFVATRRLPEEDEADHRWVLPALLIGLSGALLLAGWVVDAAGGQGWIYHAVAAVAVGLPTLWVTARSLLAGKLDVDLLMLLGGGGASAVGHFDEAAILLFLFVLASLLEAFALGRTRRALKSLMALRPDEATVERAGQTMRVPIEEVSPRETIIVGPGERVPLDGVILAGEADMDEAALTGEAVPRWKGPGQAVLAGSINLSGSLRITTTRPAGQSTLSRIVELVERARGSRAQTQRLLDRFVVFYVVLILLASTLTAVVPPLLLGAAWSDMFYRAMTLLVVASPCALVISTPATILSAIAAAARRGILFKGGAAIETLGQADLIAFDKTGTLTDGVLAVTEVESLNGHTADEVLTLVAAAESASEHPLAKAIVRAARERGLTLPAAHQFHTTTGLGVEATVLGQAVLVGSARYLEARGVQLDPVLRRQADADASAKAPAKVIWAVVQGVPVGRLVLADQLRPGVPQAVASLRRLGIDSMAMLTGDDPAIAEAMARQAGIDLVRAALLPGEKAEELQRLGESHRTTVMVGDGINDAPALAAASVGVAMGAAGTDLAIESADVVLMSSEMHKLVEAVGIGRRARRLLLQNLVFASGVIVLLVILTLLGTLPLSIGVVGHEGSTLVVVLNGLRLLGFRMKEGE